MNLSKLTNSQGGSSSSGHSAPLHRHAFSSQAHIGQSLRTLYNDVVMGEVPEDFDQLIAVLNEIEFK